MSDFPEFKPEKEPEKDDEPDTRQEYDDELAPVEASGEDSVKEPTKSQHFLRQALIWLGVIAGGFLAGFLTFYFVLYQPKVAALEEAEGQVEGLQSQLDTVTSRLESLENANQHRVLLDVMVDAYQARLAMAQENIVAAKSALSGTSAKLEEISVELETFDNGLASALQQRIELIRTNLDRDVETAIEDTDQLIDDLMQVERALFQ
jgi:signal transduction histidine kinase